jgi:FkbM family methyltransferase
MSHPLRTLANLVGLDIHRYHAAPNQLAWLRDKDIQTVFDIGANVGQFAQEIRAALPQASIYSFEPLSECYSKLVHTFKHDAQFKAFNYALGEKEERISMNKSSYTPSSSLRPMANSHKELFPHTKDSSPETIRIRRLDDVWNEIRPAKKVLIKVDTQGYEDKVIAGGLTAFKQAEVVLIEASFIQLYEGQPLFDDIYKQLKTLGFSYHGVLHQKLNNKTGEVIFEDAIFVRK